MGVPALKLRQAEDNIRYLEPPEPARVIPFVRLPPAPRRSFSAASALAVGLLVCLIFVLGIVAGSVFWFDTAAKGVAVTKMVPPEIVRLAQKQPAPQAQPSPDGIVLHAEAPAPVVEQIVGVDAFLARAQAHLDAGENSRALVLYDRVLFEHPENQAAQAGRLRALQKPGHSVVVRETAPAAEAPPQNTSKEAALAKTLAQHGKVGEAIAHFNNALTAEPGNLLYKFDLAVLYDRAGQGPRALALYLQILDAAEDGTVPLSPETLGTVRQRANYLGALNQAQ